MGVKTSSTYRRTVEVLPATRTRTHTRTTKPVSTRRSVEHGPIAAQGTPTDPAPSARPSPHTHTRNRPQRSLTHTCTALADHDDFEQVVGTGHWDGWWIGHRRVHRSRKTTSQRRTGVFRSKRLGQRDERYALTRRTRARSAPRTERTQSGTGTTCCSEAASPSKLLPPQRRRIAPISMAPVNVWTAARGLGL